MKKFKKNHFVIAIQKHRVYNTNNTKITKETKKLF